MPHVATPGYALTMPNAPKTPARQMRIPDEDWADFATAVATNDAERAEVVRQFIQWYVRRPGAKLPKRPDPTEPML